MKPKDHKNDKKAREVRALYKERKALYAEAREIQTHTKVYRIVGDRSDLLVTSAMDAVDLFGFSKAVNGLTREEYLQLRFKDAYKKQDVAKVRTGAGRPYVVDVIVLYKAPAYLFEESLEIDEDAALRKKQLYDKGFKRFQEALRIHPVPHSLLSPSRGRGADFYEKDLDNVRDEKRHGNKAKVRNTQDALDLEGEFWDGEDYMGPDDIGEELRARAKRIHFVYDEDNPRSFEDQLNEAEEAEWANLKEFYQPATGIPVAEHNL